MLYKGALKVDYGPHFRGEAHKTDGGIACVIPDRTTDRASTQAAMAAVVQRLGGNCGKCRACPLGDAA